MRQLWELVDGHALANTLRCSPALSDPEFSLETRSLIDPALIPAHLFNVFYTSHNVMSVELHGPDWEGGCLLQ